jgi:exodeoxyribonuclease III
LKITTWNINGLRATLGKGTWDWVNAHGADVLCLQEIKSRPEQLSPAQHQILSSYPHIIWNPAERPGYSGVATFTKEQPLEVELGMQAPEFDNEGRIIQTRFPDFRLFNIYFPNGGEENARVPYKLDFYARLLDLCDRLHAAGEKIIITGDFNTAHQEIDLKNPKANEKSTGFLPEERVWVTRYLEHGFVDAYRSLYPDRVQYTWWTYRFNARAKNVGWRLDYYLVSESLVPQVEDVIIYDEVMGSDHCPVSLILR